MNDYKLYINKVDLTKYSGDIEWGDNTDSISSEFSFKLANKNVNVGDIFQLINNNNEVIRGVITDEGYNQNLTIFSYQGFDYGFYLNKNEVIIQFNGIPASQAIQQLLSSVGIPYGSIVDIPIKITQIYKDKVVSDILKDIFDQAYKKTGKKYRFDTSLGRVDIFENKILEINAYYQLSNDTVKFAIQKSLSNFSASNSIQEMKNSIIVTSNDEKSNKIIGIAKDQVNINRFGLLQQVEVIDKNDPLKNQIARTLLKELNKIAKTRSLELLGADEVKSGRILKFNYPELDFVGNYEIKSCKHRIPANHHKVSLQVEAA